MRLVSHAGQDRLGLSTREKVLRFVVIGCANTGFAYACFAALYVLFRSWPYLVVMVVSREISVVFAYVLYRRFVFGGSGELVREFARFWLVYAGGLVLNLAVLPILVSGLGVRPLVGQGVVLALSVGTSAFGHSKFSFRRRQEVAPA